jgi:hypothetical protein
MSLISSLNFPIKASALQTVFPSYSWDREGLNASSPLTAISMSPDSSACRRFKEYAGMLGNSQKFLAINTLPQAQHAAGMGMIFQQ